MEGMNFIMIGHAGHRYLFFYDGESKEQLLVEAAKMAADPELTFGWGDAAVISQRLRADGKGVIF